MKQVEAAVAFILLESSREFLVVRRSAHPNDPWSYQMALPGGKKEVDEDLISTAIRETHEECGIELDQPVKALDPQIAGRFSTHRVFVQPYLFVMDAKPNVNLDLTELSAYYWVSLDEFMDASLHDFRNMSESYPNIDFPVFKVEENLIWGFTYSVLVNYIFKNHENCLNEQKKVVDHIEKLVK